MSARVYAKQQAALRLETEWRTAREDARKALEALDPGRTTAVRGIVIARVTRYDEASRTHVDQYEVGSTKPVDKATATERLAGELIRLRYPQPQRRR